MRIVSLFGPILIGVILISVVPVRAQSVDDVIADMEKQVAAEPRQDEKGLHSLYRELSEHQEILVSRKFRSRGKILAVVTDKSRDWRLRTILASCLQEDDSKSIVVPLLSIVKDESERAEVRGGAARGLGDVSLKDAAVCSELNRLAVKPGLQEATLSGIMFSVQYCGCDDPEAMSSLMHVKRANFNGLGVNFGAVRCLRTSKHPKALEYLANVIISEPKGSLIRGVALDEMKLVAQNEPKLFRTVSSSLVEPLIAMTYSENFGGGNLDGAIQLLGQAGDRRAVDRLIELLSHPQPVISCKSVEALDAIGDSKALPALMALWRNIPDDSRSNYRWRYWYRIWKKNPREPVVAALVHAIKSMGGKLDPPEHSL